jgi:NTE family protein
MRKSLLLLSLISLGFCYSSELLAQGKRPKIGLVLAGGGALGFAHVGVLKVLEENRIPIDIITGTSMGSIVGGAYAAGVDLTEMEKILTSTDWDALFQEDSDRRGTPYRFKAGRAREIYGDGKIGFKDGSMVVPAGVVQGKNVLPLLQRLYDRVPNPTKFDNLPIPFRAVAADIETGAAFVPDQGDLSKIVRASMSVPGFFAPVEWDGKLLVDGGISDNLPVGLALEMGADILIVIELYADLKKRADLGSAFSVSGQIISLLLAQNSALQKKLVRSQDIFMAPNLATLGSTDFAKGPEIMQRGQDEALKFVDSLKKLSLSEKEYFEYQKNRTAPLIEGERVINSINILNSSYLTDEALRNKLVVKEGEVLNRTSLEAGIDNIYDLGQFSKVTYQAIDGENGTDIIIDAKEKDFLKRYMRLGMALEDDFDGQDSFRLGLNYRATDVSINGSYLETEAEVGRLPHFKTELYQPIASGSNYFVAPSAYIGRSDILFRIEDEIVAEYTRESYHGTFALGREIGETGEIRAGLRYGQGEVNRKVGSPELQNLDYDIGESFAILELDDLDKPDFPENGYNFRLAQRSSAESLGASNTFNDLGGALGKPFTFDRNTLLLRTEFGVTFEDRPAENSYALGGFQDISGYASRSLVASDYFIGKALFYRRFSEMKLPILQLNFFAGVNFEVASLRSDFAQLPDQTDILAGGFFIGADTPFLPTYLGLGYNNDDELAIYLNLGRIGFGERSN